MRATALGMQRRRPQRRPVNIPADAEFSSAGICALPAPSYSDRATTTASAAMCARCHAMANEGSTTSDLSSTD